MIRIVSVLCFGLTVKKGVLMRTLNEIEEEALSGVMPQHEECYYAFLAYRAMNVLDLQKFLNMQGKQEWYIKMQAEEAYRMRQMAGHKTPKEWLGENNDPMRREFQEGRAQSERVFKNLLAQSKDRGQQGGRQ